MKVEKIENLIGKCNSYFHENGYSKSTIRIFSRLWRHGIQKFMHKIEVEEYSPQLGDEYLKKINFDGMTKGQSQKERKAIQILDCLLENGEIFRNYIPVEYPLEGLIGKKAQEFVDFLLDMRRKDRTVTHYRYYLSNLVQYFATINVTEVNQISEDDIVTFVTAWHTDKHDLVRHIRCFFEFMVYMKYLNSNFTDFFDSFKTVRKEPIPSYFSKEEVIMLEQSINRDCPSGKRSYAIFMLAARLGLRASDIAALSFLNIDWDSNTISIIMKKTGKTIELPLIGAVGNAIVDYLQNGRPKSMSGRIFLNVRAPYQCINGKSVSDIIRYVILNSGIEIGNRHYSAHSMRHTFASALLDSKIPVTTISAVLGHASINTTKHYLKADVKALRGCSLSVPEVPVEFYEQKGGYFYE